MAEDDQGQQPTSLHRLPTLSAADALQEAGQHGRKPLSLGLERLDALLRENASNHETTCGLSPGQVGEVFGPPGIGKTTLCMHAAAVALHSGSKVLWIDTAAPLVGTRLEQILSGHEQSSAPSSQADEPSLSTSEKLSHLSYYYAPTLSHLIALVSCPSPLVLWDDVVLIIVDSISAIIDHEYPRNLDTRQGSSQGDHTRWLQDRRPAAIAEVGSRLTKLASTRNVAILVTSTTVTKIRNGTSALLRSALAVQEWEKSISFGLALYRDWVYHDDEQIQSNSELSARFVQLRSRHTSGTVTKGDNVVAVRIDQSGMHEVAEAYPMSMFRLSKPGFRDRSQKRRHDEIADSNELSDSSSDYGWDGDDDQLATEGLGGASSLQHF